MSWKSLILILIAVVAMLLMVSFCVYISIDNSCVNDKASLEKRCQVAISHHRY